MFKFGNLLRGSLMSNAVSQSFKPAMMVITFAFIFLILKMSKFGFVASSKNMAMFSKLRKKVRKDVYESELDKL